MKKVVCVLLLLSNFIVAQINFEKGYYVDNKGVKKECLIKNEDWKYNPSEVYFKENESSEVSKLTIKDIQEFGFENLKYERHEVNIDFSSNAIANLSNKRDPEWVMKVVFLKCILDSKVKLYQYDSDHVYRFFYAMENAAPQQLVCKEFLNNNSEIQKNESYKQQLWNDIKCDAVTKSKINGLDYNTKEMIAFFTLVNECFGEKVVSQEKQKKSSFNLKLLAGINSNTFEIIPLNTDYYYNSAGVNFASKNTYSFGAEFEYFLPFNKKKWSLFLSPIYKSAYKQETDEVYTSYVTTYKKKWVVNYSSIDFNLGGIYHIYLNEGTSILLKGGMNYSNILTDELNNYLDRGTYVIATNNSLESKLTTVFGLGVSYKKAKLELLYSSKSIVNQLDIKDHFKTVSLNLAYTIFSKN